MTVMTSDLMNRFIPDNLNDQVFFYARKIVKQRGSHWTIYVDPNNCLVSLSDREERIPTVDELRQAVLRKSQSLDQVSYVGKVLFSGGVFLIINNKILMLFRDEKAPIDPLKWTSPAGRCDREPLFTSFKEFYEEVIIFDRISGNPIFVAFPFESYSETLKEIYCKTLTRKGFDHKVQQWVVIQANAGGRLNGHLHEVQTYFGSDETSSGSNEIFREKFFTYFDEKENTFEMRLVASISIPSEMEARIAFRDGEYERSVRLFSQEDLMLLEQSSLVSTIEYFRNLVIEERTLL